jgi:hypothetical protein
MGRPERDRPATRRLSRGLALILPMTMLCGAVAEDSLPGNHALNGIWLPDSADYRNQLPKKLPYTEAGEQAVQDYNHADDPVLRCIQDLGRISTVSFPVEIIISEAQATLLYEYGHNVRRAFLDRNDFSAAYPPSIMGYSIGHWDGDVLVIETSKLLPGQIYEQGVAPYSSEARLTERFVLNEDGSQLTIERTVDDPLNYQQPWSWQRELTRSDWDIFPYDCTVGSYGSSLN